MTYGVMRGFFEPPALSLLRGTILGAFIWLLIGFPFFMVVHPGSPPLTHAIGLYCEHVAAGGIAGFHVEFFLLRVRSKRKEPSARHPPIDSYPENTTSNFTPEPTHEHPGR
jgi:hypothetical protein